MGSLNQKAQSTYFKACPLTADLLFPFLIRLPGGVVGGSCVCFCIVHEWPGLDLLHFWHCNLSVHGCWLWQTLTDASVISCCSTPGGNATVHASQHQVRSRRKNMLKMGLA